MYPIYCQSCRVNRSEESQRQVGWSTKNCWINSLKNTGKKTIIIFGDQEMNAKWAAVTLKNKSCCKKPKLSSKATGVKIKLARIFKSLRYCLAKKKKGLIHSLVKSVTKSQILKNLCQCLTARANITCYVAWATGQRDLPTMPDCKGQHNMLRRVGNRAARPTNNAWLQGPT